MPRSPSTYSLPPGTTPQQPNTVISSSMFNAFADDVAQTFNTVQPIVYGGTGSNDLKLTDTDFGIKDNGDPTKIGQFNASGLPTATTRIYDLPYYSGTLGLVSDIRGQIYGLTLSNNVTDPTNDIDIAVGSAVDSAGVFSMPLASGLTKRLDAAWVVGTNQGGLDTGVIANTTYHMYLIRRPDTGVVDVCFSASASAPTTGGAIPAAYTQYRRIGSIIRSAGSILGFVQYGNDFYLTTPILDINSTNPGIAAVTRSLTVPGGIVVRANIIVALTNSGATGPTSVYISTLAVADLAPTLDQVGNISNASGRAIYTTSQIQVYTGTASQIRSRLTFSDANTVLRIQTMGWTDTRGAF